MPKPAVPALILASSSPRRRAILDAMGLDYAVSPTDVEERQLDGEPPSDMVQRLARAKAAAIEAGPETVVLGADTAVVVDDIVFGKPDDEAQALDMLARLSGRTHQVLTAVAACRGETSWQALSATEVRFREIHPDEARCYWQSGEPLGKAGAYAIQGRGGVFVEAISGSYSGVVGLPVYETARLLSRAGIDVLSD